MKDMRGGHVSAIRNTILRTFGLQLSSNKRRNSREILEWKQSREVEESHNKLFTGNTIEEITTSALPSLEDASDEKFNDMYIYTASVCDILLNPNYPTLEVSRKSLELRMKKFRVFIEFTLLFKN
jgi:hypothetical protein